MKVWPRNSSIVCFLSLIGAATSYKLDSFWAIVVCLLIALWALICTFPLMDFAWRFKVGLVSFAFFVTLVTIWPTVHNMSGGKVPIPAYVRDRIHFGMVKGLDLQGGMRLVYTVEVEEAIREKRDNLAEDMRRDLAVAYQFHSGSGILSRDTLQKLDAKVHVSTPQSEAAFVRLQFKDLADVSTKADDRFKKRYQVGMALVPSANPTEVVFKILSQEESQIRNSAVQQAKDTIGRRVDELGLREASVTVRDEDIIVEVPGNDKQAFEEIKETIRRTARLEFKMVDDESNLFKNIKEEELPEGGRVFFENAPVGPGRTAQSYYVRLVKKPDETMNACKERLKTWVKTLTIPDDHQVGFMLAYEYNEENDTLEEIGWRTIYLYSRADVTGDLITDARAEPPSQVNPVWAVGLRFNNVGAERFEETTGANIKRRFAILLDDVVNSAPQINTKISGGGAQITMGAENLDKQREDARKLELVLRSGALPAPISPSNETLIGPTLGQDAIQKGLVGAIIGTAFVLAFMVLYYRKSGVVADLAVLFNLALQLAILARFNATMTLPGIAGLALTIGMAVDANVLINERIREELRAGRSIRASIDAGYSKAFWAIFDGHVTIFISGLILSQYGTGPVKGFAITLIVGIIASLFTGVFCTRLAFEWWARGAKVKELSVGIHVRSEQVVST